MDNLLSIVSVYLFVLIGYMAKKMLQDAFDEKGIVKLNIYFLLSICDYQYQSGKSFRLQTLNRHFTCLYLLCACFGIFQSDLALVGQENFTVSARSAPPPLYGLETHHKYPHRHNPEDAQSESAQATEERSGQGAHNHCVSAISEDTHWY